MRTVLILRTRLGRRGVPICRRPAGPLLFAAGLLALLLAACGDGGGDRGGTGDEELLVVASTSILGDLVSDLVGADGRVEVLIPRGVDPHDFQLSSRQAALLQEADLVVVNGLGLEEGMEDVLRGAADEGSRVLWAGEVIDPLPFQDPDGANGHGPEEEGTGGADPHFWHDPLRMADVAVAVAAELGRVDGALEPGEWAARGTDLVEEYRSLHRELEGRYASIPPERRRLVTTHHSLGYLAARYELEVVGTVIPGGSTLGEASSAELAELVRVIREAEVAAIFTENVVQPAVVEALAEEVGRQVVVVALVTDALGPEGSEADSYPGMMRVNAARISEALGGDAGASERTEEESEWTG